MKKILVLIVLLSSNYIWAQTIPNAGFEQWSQQGPSMFPTSWFGSPGVLISSNAHSGNYAVLCKVDTATNPKTKLVDTVPAMLYSGAATMGPPLKGKSFGGYAFSGNVLPDTLSGWFQYSPVGGDSCRIIVNFCHWNTSLNKRDTLGFGTKTFGDSVKKYTQFNVKIRYSSAITPDTVFIQFMAADPRNGKHIGTALLVDDLSWVGGTVLGIEDAFYKANLCLIYPNHEQGILHIKMQGNSKLKSISIYNALGQLVLQSNNLEINTSGLPKGIYTLRITDMDEQYDIQKFMHF